jgi:tRNA modification GTPase
MRIETDSTIAAIASGPEGAIRGIVRITGPDTLPVLERLVSCDAWRAWQRRSARVLDATVTTASLGEIPVAIHVWPDHRSYTGQPSAELHLLGAPMWMQAVQSELLSHGVRMAQPGEFTLRAFLAGRMDLTQCEAVLGLIHAENEHAFQVALTQLAGGVAGPLKGLRQDLIYLLADLEAGLDFVDEDIEFVRSEDIVARLQTAIEAIDRLHQQMQERAGQTSAYQVVVLGLPNAGKSSLVNALTGREVAIISDQAGTTRDYVRSRLKLEGIEVDLLDTAGIEAIDEVSPRGIAQTFTREQFQHADLVVVCEPCDERESAEALSVWTWLRAEANRAAIWRVHTKCDLMDSEAHRMRLRGRDVGAMREFVVSVKSGQGLDALRSAIGEEVVQQRSRRQDVVPMTADRCRSALVRVSESLRAALDAVQGSAGDEIVAGELRLALEDLGEVAGTVVNNDILDALFSRFCIGK